MKKYGVLVFLAWILTWTGCGNASEQGITHLEQKEYNEAITSFATAISEEKDVAQSYRGMGIAYWELGKYEDALDAFVNVLNNGGKADASLYQYLGDCEMILRNYEEALSYYWKGMSCEGLTEEQLQEMLYNEIIAFEQLKDWSSAKEKVTAYVQKYPEDEAAKKEAEFLETR